MGLIEEHKTDPDLKINLEEECVNANSKGSFTADMTKNGGSLDKVFVYLLCLTAAHTENRQCLLARLGLYLDTFK